MRWLSRLVTILLIVGVVVLFASLVRSKMPATQVGQAFTTCASFRDGTRLAVGSPVLIAGVRVGEISRISLTGKFARVDMRLINGVEIPVDSWVTKRAFSPFGDSYLEILPSTPDPGAAPAVNLAPGQCIARVIEGSSTDTVLRSMNKVLPNVDEGLDTLHRVAIDGRKWASGRLEDRVLGAEHWLDERQDQDPLGRANEAMARLEVSTRRAADALSAVRPDVDNTLTRVADGVAQARHKITELKADMKDGLAGVRSGLDGADETIADVQEVLVSIDENKNKPDYTGTLGKLVNDPELADSIEEGTESAREGLGSFGRFKSYLGLRTEFNWFSRAPRFFVTAEVRARTDKFYLVELEKGPLGAFPEGQISNGPPNADYVRHQEIHDKIRFTVQFGKQFGNNFQVRGGIKESTFGFGVDVLMGQGRLKFSTDLYGGYTRVPRLKLASALEVFRSVYLIAGIDDAMNTPGYFNIQKGNTNVPIQFDQVRYGRDYFLGAQLQFDDADLAMLLRVYGALLVGLL
ncbi:MAG TPA: MlaD family protein [Kofleriaceae bacterium]|nr:MlaD family protein [Kofleriaceae bacterium]